MNNTRLVNIVNDLLALERESYLDRVVEAGNYVSWAIAGRMHELQRMAAEESDHEQWLTDEIFRLGGAPTPHPLGMDTAAGHYLDFAFVFPRLIEDKQKLIDGYKKALSLIAPNSPTARLLTSVLSRHQAHLAQLKPPIASAAEPVPAGPESAHR